MGSLSDELLKTGLVSKERHQQIERSKADRERAKLPRIETVIGKDVDELDHYDDVQTFRSAVRTILFDDSSLIRVVLKKAQRLRHKDGGRRLLWQLYQIRDRLETLPKKEHADFLRKALRRHGIKLD